MGRLGMLGRGVTFVEMIFSGRMWGRLEGDLEEVNFLSGNCVVFSTFEVDWNSSGY